MIAKTILISALIAYAEARFGQEQVPIQAIGAVQGGDPGQAQTIAGGAISDLLGAANACDKLATADKIVSDLGGGADAIAAAIGMVTAEKNTNPSLNDNAQNVCSDATLPATAELRGITPLIDPAVDVDGVAAQLSADSAKTPLNADGMSVFDLMVANGAGDLVVAQDSAGGAGAAAGGADAGNADANQNQGAADDNQDDEEADACDAENANNGTANAGNDQAQAGQGNAGNDQADAGNATAGAQAGTAAGLAGADFGQCTPTIIFEAGQPGRKPDEFTFQIADPLARGGQQDALNPVIIVTALCNQLTNVCEANDAAVSACKDAASQVDATQKNKATADTFNAALGFAGAVTNPDGGPADVTAAARKMRRGLRML